MTTLFALLLAMTLLFGCSAGPVSDVKLAALPAREPLVQTQEDPVAQALRYEVEMTLREDTLSAEDGTVLLRYAFEVPVLSVWRADGSALTEAATPQETAALAAADSFNQQFDTWSDSGDVAELVQAAAEHLAFVQEAGLEWHRPYELSLDCTVYRTDRLVSVTGTYYSDTLGAHPNRNLLAWNFNLQDGKLLTPEHLAADSPAFLQAVKTEIVRQCQARAAEQGCAAEELFWADYATIAENWSSYAVSFDSVGMTVAFSPYELACYAAGPQSFVLPYQQLTPYFSQHGQEVLGLTAP